MAPFDLHWQVFRARVKARFTPSPGSSLALVAPLTRTLTLARTLPVGLRLILMITLLGRFASQSRMDVGLWCEVFQVMALPLPRVGLDANPDPSSRPCFSLCHALVYNDHPTNPNPNPETKAVHSKS